MTQTNSDDEARRPIGVRSSGWAAGFARWLTRRGITPNAISISSVIFAGLAAWLFYESACACRAPRSVLLILAALCVQLRLLANLFDGMVAVEGGKAGKDGSFWNEFPDRVSDVIIFLGIGYGLGGAAVDWAWAAGALAILTAYIRELGRANGQPADFCGPMAKPHRMIVVTLGALFTATQPLWDGEAILRGQALKYVLILIVIGTAITVVRRCWRQIAWLKAR